MSISDSSIRTPRRRFDCTQHTSWVFGRRLREAGLLGSMGRVASSVNNGLVKSLWSTMQRELLDHRVRAARDDGASAIFEWIKGFFNPVRRHSALGYSLGATYETLTPAVLTQAA